MQKITSRVFEFNEKTTTHGDSCPTCSPDERFTTKKDKARSNPPCSVRPGATWGANPSRPVSLSGFCFQKPSRAKPTRLFVNLVPKIIPSHTRLDPSRPASTRLAPPRSISVRVVPSRSVSSCLARFDLAHSLSYPTRSASAARSLSHVALKLSKYYISECP